MSPRAELTFHSILALILCAAAIAAVIWAGHWLAGLQGLRGKALEGWMLGAVIVGLFAGLLAFFGYRRWLLPKRLHGMAPPGSAQQRAQQIARDKAIAAFAASQQALREELLATPGLEQYAALVGRSTIRSVDDAREREARVCGLRADPVKAKYADRVFNGELITDRMIDYLEDPRARVLCEHLAGLEADVRKVDRAAAPSADNVLDANLSFEFEVIKRHYALGDTISFWREEFGPNYYGRGEDYYDGKQRIECTQHGCALAGAERRPAFVPGTGLPAAPG